MTMIPPPGWVTREKADRVAASLQAGMLEAVNQLEQRLKKIVPTLVGKDEAAIKAMVKKETDRAVAEMKALQAIAIEQLESTEQ
jgi:hypothetical protein